MKKVSCTLGIFLTAAALSGPAGAAEIHASSATDVKAFNEMFGQGPQEEEVFRTDKMLITATGSQVPVFKAPSVATVITSEDIASIGATTLDELLETVPGLHVLPSGLNIFSSLWSIRGVHTKINPQVLLLINGIPLTRPYDGGRPHTFGMPVAMISQVEIIRGPGSAVHGADAFAGVINVITKDNFEIDGSEMGLRYGSFNTIDGWLLHGGQYSGWDMWGSFESQMSDGDKDRIVDKDYLHTLGFDFLSAAPGYLDTSYHNSQTHIGLRKENFTARFYGNWSDDNAMGPSALQIVDYNNDVNTTNLMADLEYRDKKFAQGLDLRVRLHYVYLDGDNTFQITPKNFGNMIGRPIVTSQYSGLESTLIYEGINRHRLRMAAGIKFFDSDTEAYQNFGTTVNPAIAGTDNLEYIGPESPDIFMKPQNRRLYFVSLQDEWDFARNWNFTGGVRYDDYSDFGSTINPRAALVWETTHVLATKLMYGRAFRTPSFQEQNVSNNPLITGNQNLDPEFIQTIELAFDYQPLANFRTQLNFFYYEAKDLIEYRAAGIAENYGEQDGRGFEIDLDWQINNNFGIHSNFAYQHAVNAKIEATVHDAPELQFYLNPHWLIARDWSVVGQYYWIADRNREKDDSRPDIADYDLVNLTLRRSNIANQMDLALAVRNLFDEDIREPSPYDSNPLYNKSHITNDYPMEGRAIWCEFSIKL